MNSTYHMTRGNSVTESKRVYDLQEHVTHVCYAIARLAKTLRPIPNYIKGCNDVPSGPAMIGERGREILSNEATRIRLSHLPPSEKLIRFQYLIKKEQAAIKREIDQMPIVFGLSEIDPPQR